MNKKWFPIFLVAALLGLLSVMAFLQYRWLGQISDGERERLHNRLEADTRRFADDFNREMQNAYFNFQLPAEVWQKQNWNEFNKRYEFWHQKTPYPDLIRNFYFVTVGDDPALLRYDFEKKTFEAAGWTDDLRQLKPQMTVEGVLQPIVEKIPALLMPVHKAQENFNRVFTVKTRKPEKVDLAIQPKPEKYGILVIELNVEVFKEQIFPNLVKKYFSDSESANYKLAVVNRENASVFQTDNLTAPDSSIRFFDLAPEDFMFFANRDLVSSIEGGNKSMVFSKIETNAAWKEERKEQNTQLGVQVVTRDQPDISKQRVRVFESGNLPNEGIWTLNVQHSAGSLEQFITNTRRKNLAVSFGILFLLGVSVVLIFVSAQRAKLFAQRQVDFVSSVSHEFRTPLAVIFSAGENLADGVAKEKGQVSRYGRLIKGEGRKLSAMVEQILEFAGANSGKKKYDLRETTIGPIIEKAVAECQPLIDEQGFEIESEIADQLSSVQADENALSRALQNLIINGLKYSNGTKWLKISAQNGGGKIKISVEDRGIGIDPHDLPHIFEPFFRSRKVVDEQIHGNGLGLSLVKQIVTAHGGKIKVESESGKGSKFTIEIPQKES